jgi:hypothetical protein
VSLAALIAAYHEADDPPGTLRATLPLAGRTLVERQARLAAAAGADPIVIVVERLPPELLAAIDRMRAEGISAAIARSAAEAAEAVPADARLLLMADGLVADEDHLSRVAMAGGFALLTIPDHLADRRFERIDADSHWAGLALVDSGLLRQTASSLGDWDLQSTLLRRAVQAGARQFALRGEALDDRLVIAQSAEDLAEVQSLIVEGSAAGRGNWISRYLLSPVEQAATYALMPTSVTPGWLYLAAAVTTGLAATLFTRGWLGIGMLLLLLATPLDGTADRLAVLRMQRRVEPDWWSYTLPIVSGMALAALGYALSSERGWGCLALVATTIAFLIALRGEIPGPDIPGRIWLAEPKGMTWLLLPFAVTGRWVTGLTALACYAAGSFFWAQRHAHRPFSAPKPD